MFENNQTILLNLASLLIVCVILFILFISVLIIIEYMFARAYQKSIIQIIRFKNELFRIFNAYPKSFKGCDDAEIQQLIKSQGVSFLPSEYIQMMRLLGHSNSELKTNVKFFYRDLLNLKKDAQQAARRFHWEISNDMFVFMESSGAYFIINMTDREYVNIITFGLVSPMLVEIDAIDFFTTIVSNFHD